MRIRAWTTTILAIAAVVAAVVAGLAVAVGETPAADEEPAADGPVVVELFTSQGCSSCPPADRLLSRLADEGVVYPLSFHVDYWNYIGWTDPFSSPSWSERQRRYAKAFRSGQVYTPQIVVAGAAECVGSREGCVRDAIAAAPPADGRVSVAVAPDAADGRLSLAVDAEIERGTTGDAWDVLVAVVESDLVTSVKRGENSGRKLENDRVVRVLERAFSIPSRAGARGSGTVEIALGEGWRRDRLSAVAFLQDPATMRIHGAAALSLSR